VSAGTAAGLAVALAILNGVSFALFAADKRRARRGRRRIPESTLLGSALVSGTIGAWLGVRLLRHKTRKPRFLLALAVITALDAALLVFLLTW
jgi:uncharacterized membrane protein YsdA (DUF1294 family)